MPLDVLTDLTSMGTLVAFTIVSLGVLVLRRTRPQLARGFAVPLFPLTPILSVLACLYLVCGLPAATFLLFGAWLAAALVFYFTYSIHHSTLEAPHDARPHPQY